MCIKILICFIQETVTICSSYWKELKCAQNSNQILDVWKRNFVETQLTRKCYEIPMCGKEILWKHKQPVDVVKFLFVEKRHCENINIYLCLWAKKVMKFLIGGARQIFNSIEYSEASAEFLFWKREIVKCQLPIYIGKRKIMCHVMMTS